MSVFNEAFPWMLQMNSEWEHFWKKCLVQFLSSLTCYWWLWRFWGSELVCRLPHRIHSLNERQISPRANSVKFVLNELLPFFQMNVCPWRVVQTVQAVNTTANCELQECADSGRWLPTSCVVTICFTCSWGQHFSPGGAGKKSFDGSKAIWLQCAVS